MTIPPQSSRLSAPDLEKIKSYLISNISHELEASPPPINQRREVVTQLMESVYESTKLRIAPSLKQQIFRDVIDSILGYGPIQPLLEDPTITEVMVNGPKQVYIERAGKLIRTNVAFENDDHVIRIIEKIILPLGRRVDVDNPTVDARLPDGSRVNAVIPPVAIDGPNITIRKFSKEKLTINQLIQYGSISPKMAEFLEACVVARLNILITGNTSSGKTTLLNILTSFIPGSERIITIEDAAELNLKQKYTVRLETKNAGVDGTGAVTTRDLVRNALRMRPDRIVVGEVRSGEAMDMLQAMNTGHDGSMTTLHANSPRDAISRIETMAMMAGLDLPLLAIRQQIASAIDLIIHMDRLTDGTRKVVRISEVPRMEGEVVTLSDLFRFDQTGVNSEGRILGEMRATGLRPIFTPRLEVVGYKLRGEIFGG